MKRLLVLRLSALGDVIHTIPAVALLRSRFDVTWVVEAPYAELVEIVAGVPAVAVRMKKWGRAPLRSRGEIAAARTAIRGFDVAVDFQGLLKSAVLAWLSGAPERFGFDREAIREKPAGLFLNRRVAVERSQHVVDWNRQLARGVAGDAEPAAVRWEAYPADPQQRVEALGGRIVLLPGAGRSEKLWPAGRFREVARHFGKDALVVWGPGERHLADAIGAPAAPETNLRELASILSRARVVVGADTGPLHLAAAFNVPTVGLFGPTNPMRNGPYGQLERTISTFGSSKTMEGIVARDVIDAIEKAVRR